MNAQLRAHATRLRLIARRLVGRAGGGSLVARRRGLGCEFLELREYANGDDVRRIDWKGSARARKLLVREYYEDARRTVCILYDRSSSMESIADSARSCALLVLYAAEQAGDEVGLVAFDSAAHCIAPSAHRSTHRRIEKEISVSATGRQKKTSFMAALETLTRAVRHRSLICVISDGIDHAAAEACAAIARRHDIVFFRLHDEMDTFLASHIYSDAEDPESSEHAIHPSILASQSDQFFSEQQKMLESKGVLVCPVSAGEAAYEEVIRCFMRRRVR